MRCARFCPQQRRLARGSPDGQLEARSRTQGIVAGAAAIAWPQARYHLGAAEHVLTRINPDSIHPPGAVFESGGVERPPRHEKGPLLPGINF